MTAPAEVRAYRSILRLLGQVLSSIPDTKQFRSRALSLVWGASCVSNLKFTLVKLAQRTTKGVAVHAANILNVEQQVVASVTKVRAVKVAFMSHLWLPCWSVTYLSIDGNCHVEQCARYWGVAQRYGAPPTTKTAW